MFKRLIGVILISNGWVIHTKKFQQNFPLGKPKYHLEKLDFWNCDEIVILDVSRGRKNNDSYQTLAQSLFKDLNMRTPIAVGGGLDSLETCLVTVASGADRVVLTSMAINNPEGLITIIQALGAQAVMVAIPFRLIENRWIHWDLQKNRPYSELATSLARLGRFLPKSVEIILISMDRDGTSAGFPVDVLRCGLEDHNYLVSGGIGNSRQIDELISRPEISGVCVGSRFQFVEDSVRNMKRGLKTNQIRPPEEI